MDHIFVDLLELLAFVEIAHSIHKGYLLLSQNINKVEIIL